MPDGLTHLLASYSASNRWLLGSRMTLFLIGAVLPDLLLRGGRLFLYGFPDQDFMELYLVPLHTPFTCLIVCMGIAQLFCHETRVKSFVILYLGCLSHFVLDLFQRSIYGTGLTVEPFDGYHWLYPFSAFDFQIGLFWAEDAPFLLLILVPLSLWIFLRLKKERVE